MEIYELVEVPAHFHPANIITREPGSRTEDGGDKLEIQNMIESDREEKEKGRAHSKR